MGDLGGPYDAIVIGSGMSGLVSANVLAREGWRVLVCEQHERFGGLMQQFARERTPFDTGCHYVGALGEGQVFDRYLRYLGVRDRIEAVPLDPDGFDRIHVPGAEPFAIPVGHEALGRRLAHRYPAEAEGVRRYVQAIRAEVACFPMYTLEPTRDPRGDGGTARTVDEVLDECGIRHPAIRELLCMQGLLYFVPPDECPFRMHAFVTDSFLQGAYAIQGGGHAFIRALLGALQARGGVAKKRQRVAEIRVRNRRVEGIRTASGEVEDAPVVIATMHPKAAATLLPEGAARPAWRRRVNSMRDGLGGFCCYLRVSEQADLTPISGHNLLFAGDRGIASLYDGSWVGNGARPPAFVTAPSTREPHWRGPHSVIGFTGVDMGRFDAFSATRVARRPPAYDALKRQLAGRVQESIESAMPQIRGYVLSCEASTPLTHRDYTGSAGGAIYGLHHSVDQTGMRGVSWRTGVRGLLLAGQSVLYPGLLGATISAFYATSELLGLEKLHRSLCGDAS